MNTQLFKQIEDILPTLPGWCSPKKATVLASTVVAMHPKVTVEIGIFGGSSFLPLALAHKAIDCGIIWGIDPWSQEAGVEAQTEEESRKWWANLDYNKLHDDFQQKLRDTGTARYSEIYRRRSRDVVPPPVIDLLHIDGAHSDEAVEDVTRWASHVRMGGMVCCDDVHWYGGGVERAIEKLVKMGFRELYNLETGAMFQRVKE